MDGREGNVQTEHLVESKDVMPQHEKHGESLREAVEHDKAEEDDRRANTQWPGAAAQLPGSRALTQQCPCNVHRHTPPPTHTPTTPPARARARARATRRVRHTPRA
jgi:hypothetical protein